MRRKLRSERDQRGSVLIVSLMLLLMLTLMGLAALQSTTLEEKMASNAGEQGVAFQGAELALRMAEAEIRNSTSSGVRFTTKYPGSATDPDSLRRTIGSEGFDAACTNGLCLLTAPCGSVQDCATARATKAVGILTGANAALYNTLPLGTVPGVIQPRWVIDFSCEPVPGNSNCQYTYVITAMGFGSRLSTQVTLEAMFRGI